MEQDIHFLGTTLDDIKSFPVIARQQAGYGLGRIQLGLDPKDWKPMPSVGKGVKEIRIHVGNQYRVIYVAKYHDNIHVLHAFMKKTQKTEKRDIELAKKRLQEIRR